MGKAHAEQMAIAGIQTTAVCDLDPARLKAAQKDLPGVKTFTDHERMLQEADVDLCVVILPHNLHAPIAIECAKAGKHVVVEKPMCMNTQEGLAMMEAARASKVMLSVFHNRRWDGDFVTIREVVESGLIGDLFRIELSIGGFGPPGDTWRSHKKTTGSHLLDWGVHFLDWTLHLVPSNPVAVLGQFVTGAWNVGDIENHTEATILFENGCQAQIRSTMLGSAPKPKWALLGTKGGITADWGETLRITVMHQGHPAIIEKRCKPTDVPAYYKNVADHLMHDAELVVKPEESLRTVSIVEAAERSSRTGKLERPDFA